MLDICHGRYEPGIVPKGRHRIGMPKLLADIQHRVFRIHQHDRSIGVASVVLRAINGVKHFHLDVQMPFDRWV